MLKRVSRETFTRKERKYTMGRIIAIANQKGGVGKTTTAINLSACLAEAGQKVLTIDIDPQGNTTSGLGIDKNSVENTIYELILEEVNIKEAIIETEFENLSIIASNVNLAAAEIELIGINEKVDNQCYDYCRYSVGTNSVRILCIGRVKPVTPYSKSCKTKIKSIT